MPNTPFDPQFEREVLSLNGTWEIEVVAPTGNFIGTIQVPFCIESARGLNYRGVIERCVYRKQVTLARPEGRLFLRFGAVDRIAHVYINGNFAGEHRGGYTPFKLDITSLIAEGTNEIAVEVENDVSANAPSGKQSIGESHGCFYSRVTGIWQPVWLECVPEAHIERVRFYPDVEGCSVTARVGTRGEGELCMEVFYEGRLMGKAEAYAAGSAELFLPLREKHLWEAGAGRLYDVVLRFGSDSVKSYFGLRDVRFEKERFLLNGKPVFQRLVLDQGYHPEGLYTYPDEESMVRDIRLAMELGFNGARLHQKLFDPRFLYHCDRLGYMVWGEFPSWGMHYSDLNGLANFKREWAEAVERDFNHPAIVLWCPLNETWADLDEPEKLRDVRFIDAVYDLTKDLDPTRPCVDVSGGWHGHRTDLFDFHCYESVECIGQYLQGLEEETLDVPHLYSPAEDLRYHGGPTLASEVGGVSLGGDGWGYTCLSSEEEFLQYYERLVSLLGGCRKLAGFCYTQLYDVEQEQNGLYTYARVSKLSEAGLRRIVACNRMKAAIECE